MISRMERELITRTNKAEFFRLADGSLLKQYLPDKKPVEKVRQDQRSLQYLEHTFGEVYHEGWVYRTVKLLELAVDQREVRLEFVHLGSAYLVSQQVSIEQCQRNTLRPA